MVIKSDVIKLTYGDALAYGVLRVICQSMINGGVCILPSDTGYSLASLPFRKDVIVNINKLLPDQEMKSIPLSFGTLAMVEKFAYISGQGYRTIDQFCPGPITIVCKIKTEIADSKNTIEKILNTSGTIGVRIPDSPVERQISNELERPITTCAIRDSSNQIIQQFDEALDIVKSRINSAGLNIDLIAIRANFIKYTEHSTVASVNPRLSNNYDIHIFREGAISSKLIKNCTKKISYRDIEDWT